jgi:hypothetical protein
VSEQTGPSLADIESISKAALEAATAATSKAQAAEDSAAAARETAANIGLNLPDEVIERIAQATSAAWQADMRQLGVLTEDGSVAEQVAEHVEAAAGAVTPDPGDEIIFPTFAHRVAKIGVRRRDWEAA